MGPSCTTRQLIGKAMPRDDGNMQLQTGRRLVGEDGVVGCLGGVKIRCFGTEMMVGVSDDTD